MVHADRSVLVVGRDVQRLAFGHSDSPGKLKSLATHRLSLTIQEDPEIQALLYVCHEQNTLQTESGFTHQPAGTLQPN